ncbi:chemotaxis protein CheW [Halococcoides cellulosivorans]|uniref:Chemotaxis protein CheW n=1 Tax=Halococcoides cellulosivorans TaxID=1679096 RepID=A0A2R4X090_9EURY|nr:chemotaxis protein CheW [Halococcoides cellulosivorans]AWB27171.1 chemotaxis protein CheW [Halococcoides cellulosivorans]
MSATIAADERVQVLEFGLGTERYCVAIEYVTEIVDVGTVTAVPNAPRYVEGVMDLRGRTTSIVDPTVLLGVDGESDPQRIVVFDPETVGEDRAVGWLVDEVYQVLDVESGDVEESPAWDDSGEISGVVKRENGFLIWVDPQSIHA